MRAGPTTLLEGPSPHSDEAFQRLLLRFSAAAARATSPPDLIHLFCHATREFFRVAGVYFWRCAGPDELVGAEADGLMAEQFRGTRLGADGSAVAADAVRKRKTVYINRVDWARYPMAEQYHA